MCAALTTNHLVQNTLKQGPITGVRITAKIDFNMKGLPTGEAPHDEITFRLLLDPIFRTETVLENASLPEQACGRGYCPPTPLNEKQPL